MTISTVSDPKYWETTFSSTISLNNQPYIDVLSDKYIDLLDGISTATDYIVKDGDKLTTVCYNFYGNTSLYYLILHYNGLLFWEEVQPGDIVRIPNIGSINNFFSRNRQQYEESRVVI